MAVAPRPIYPQFALDEQIDGHQRRNDRAADIYRNHRASPMANDRNGIAHAKEINDVVGHGTLRRQLRDWNVENTADQRGEE